VEITQRETRIVAEAVVYARRLIVSWGTDYTGTLSALAMSVGRADPEGSASSATTSRSYVLAETVGSPA